MKIQALVGCQNGDCATEISYHLDMVRMWDRQPICEGCYNDAGHNAGQPWDDLPAVRVADLSE